MDGIHQTLRWIHHNMSSADWVALVADVAKRLARQPSSLRSSLLPSVRHEHGTLVAACYFKLLSGDVATLGGVRATPDFQDAAIEMVVLQAAELRRSGVAQVQAVVPEQDQVTSQLLERAGLTRLTHVQHHWLDLTRGGIGSEMDHHPPVSSLLWRAAETLATTRLARLIEGTFLQTLDCPALNGLRTRAQVLDGFLDGRPLRSMGRLWEVLEYRGESAGCLLLEEHGDEVLELVYLGLLPQARGKRLGKQLVNRAITHATHRRASALVAAVDQQNWPALELYGQFGFQSQQRFEVFLLTE